MSICFGIYIGNSTCCVAVNKDGKVDVVANAAGDRVTPAVVAFHQNEVVTGVAAKQGMLRHGSSTVKGALRLIGNSSDDDVAPVGAPCQPSWDAGQPVFNVHCGESIIRVLPDKVIKNVFQLLKGITTSHSSKGCEVTITVPAWANDSTIAVVKNMATAAGFKVLSVISQPAAACLAYNLLDDNKDSFTALLLHCGNSSSVATIVEVAGGLVTVKDSTNTSSVAGDSITRVLVQHFAKEFFMKYKADPMENRRSKLKLYNSSESCKHVLSTMSTAQVHIDSLWEGVDLSTSLSRSRFEGLVSSTLSQILQPLKDLVQKCDLDITQINKVILTGGTCKIPKLQQMISDTFTSAEVLSSVSTDEALAYGAAIEAANIQAGVHPVHSMSTSMVPALAVPIYCKFTDNKENMCVFTKGTPMHSRQSLTLPMDSSSPSLCVIIYETTAPEAPPQDDQILAELELASSLSKSQHLILDFNLKSDGSLVVNVKDETKVLRSFLIEAGRS